MSTKHYYDKTYNLTELADNLRNRLQRSGQPVEAQKIFSWLNGWPEYIIQIAVDELVGKGEIVSYWAGPPRRERRYLCLPQHFRKGEAVWFLSAAPAVEKTLDYELTSYPKRQAEAKEQAQAQAARREEARKLGEKQHAEYIEKQNLDCLDSIEADWSIQHRELHRTLIIQADKPPGLDERKIRHSRIGPTLARRKRDYVAGEFKKRLQRPIPERLLNQAAPLPAQPQPA